MPFRPMLPKPAWLPALFMLLVAGSAAAQPAQQPARESVTVDPTLLMRPQKGDLDAMIERRVIRVLTAYSKTFYFANKGVQRGLTHDAFRAFEEDLNKQLAKSGKLKQKNLKVRVVLIPIGRGDLLQALADGKGDIAAANLTITPERQKLVDFSAPVYRNVSEVLVSGPASPALHGVGDLSGRDVFVRKSSSYHDSLLALNRQLAAQRKPGVVIRLAPEELEDEDLVEMVNAGLIPLIVMDKHKADLWKQVFPRITVHDGVVVRSGGSIAWAIRKGSPQLKGALDDFLARHGQGTAIGNTILQRYLKSAKYVKDAASETERRKFLSMVQYFRKYGDKYDVDWLLMAAQGYQESQLDHSARSHVGAIGVMQIMPATGKELKVGDIRTLESNIHGGIKYMRFMIDQYYGNEAMTKLDKALFAFASYNAGPARVRQLRAEAARRGLDPNVWFHNVEYVAAEKIGPETVTYVSNIYKYYIAYRLIIEAQEARNAAAKALKGEKRP